MNRYSVWVVIFNEKNKPQMKRGEMINEADDEHDNIKIDGKIEKIKIDRIFDNMQDTLNKCKELDND